MSGRGEERVFNYVRSELERVARATTVTLRLHPQRSEAGNRCPDLVVDMEVLVPLFQSSPPLRVKIPLLIEVEACGFANGLQDLEKYVQRASAKVEVRPPDITLPFVVATEDGGRRQKQSQALLPVKFDIQEIGMPE